MKISKVELTIDREKDPLSPKMIKQAKLYFVKMKQDSYKIKFCVDCIPADSAKQPREKSGFSDSDTGTKRQDRRASHSTSKENGQRTFNVETERELNAFLGVDSQRSSSATRQGHDQKRRRANVNA